MIVLLEVAFKDEQFKINNTRTGVNITAAASTTTTATTAATVNCMAREGHLARALLRQRGLMLLEQTL